MQKTFKRFLAILMAVMLIYSVVPTTVFAAEVPSEPESTVSGEAPQEPEPTPSAVVTPELSEEPAPTSTPETSEPAESTTEPSAESKETESTTGLELPITQIWPAPQRKARSAPFGTNGTLYMGDECYPGGVGTPPPLG